MSFFSRRLGRVLHLGRRVPTARPPIRQLDEFLSAPLPPAPPVWSFAPKAGAYPMYANDRLGDCVEASNAHLIQTWTGNESNAPKLFTDEQVIAMYSRDGGYIPGQPWTDRGVNMVEALTNWMRHGWNGCKLEGFVSCGPAQGGAFASGVYAFGGAKLGVNMPAAWQGAFESGKAWDVGPSQRGEWAPGTWGGHDVPIVGRTARGWQVVTWGGLQTITDAALRVYCDESYLCASWDWATDGEAPSQIVTADLVKYWEQLGGGTITPPPLPPVPPVPPIPTAGNIVIDTGAMTYSFPPGWKPSTSARGAKP